MFCKGKLNYFLSINEENNIQRKISYLLVVFRNVLYVENPHSKGLAYVVVPEHDNDKKESKRLKQIFCMEKKTLPKVKMNSSKMIVRKSFISTRVTLRISVAGIVMKILFNHHHHQGHLNSLLLPMFDISTVLSV